MKVLLAWRAYVHSSKNNGESAISLAIAKFLLKQDAHVPSTSSSVIEEYFYPDDDGEDARFFATVIEDYKGMGKLLFEHRGIAIEEWKMLNLTPCVFSFDTI